MSSTNSSPTPLGSSNLSNQKLKGKQKSKLASASSSHKPEASKQFTPMMQDAQARGKNPYPEEDDGESSDSSSMEWHTDDRFNAFGFDNYTRTQQRRGAAVILDSPELIMMHALARGDSIPATRNYFTKMLCGYLDPDEVLQDQQVRPQGLNDTQKKQKEKPRGRKDRLQSSMGVD